MAYTPEQKDVIRRALAVAKKKGASARVKKALVEAMGVESNYRDLDYGDRDSKGVLQQRNNGAWGAARESVEKDVGQFVDKAMAANRTFKGSAGQLAQEIQRSGFPGRYDERSGEAEAILRKLGGGSGGGSPDRSTTTTPTSETTPGQSFQAERGAAALEWLQQRKRGGGNEALMQLASIPRDTPAQTTLSATQSPSNGNRAPHGSATSSKGMSKLLELFWEGQGAIDYNNKSGRLADNAIGGHSDHVHVAAGPKTTVALGKLAESMGLHVGENPHFGGVNPVHVTNSNHYRGQAIDVSAPMTPEGKKLMAHFAATVAHKYGLKINNTSTPAPVYRKPSESAGPKTTPKPARPSTGKQRLYAHPQREGATYGKNQTDYMNRTHG